MRVLHVITYLSDGGGAEKLLEDLLPALRDKNVDISVAVLRDIDTNNSRNLRENGIDIIKVGGGRSLYSPIKMLKLIPIMREYDVVHTHLTPPFLMGAFNKAFCKAKFVCTIHNTDSKFRHIIMLRTIEKWAYSRYDALIACSIEAEEKLREFWDNGKTTILTVNNGVKLEKFINAKPSDEVAQIPGKKILMVAVFRTQKDHECLIRAAKLLPEDYHVCFVGYGELLDNMKELATTLGISNRIHFMGKRTDVPQLLMAADFIVLSSHYEGLSISSIEAMAAGKPFIASNVPGLKEMVGGYGVLFEESNAQQLAGIIKALSENEEEYRRVACQCHTRAMAFNIENTAQGYIDVYAKLLK